MQKNKTIIKWDLEEWCFTTSTNIDTKCMHPKPLQKTMLLITYMNIVKNLKLSSILSKFS